MVADGAVKPSGLQATLLETGVQIHTDIDRCVLVSPRASSRLEQRELRASREFRMGIPFLRLLERSKAVLVFELRFLTHGAPPSLPAFSGRRHFSRPARNGRAAQLVATFRSDVKTSAEDVEQSENDPTGNATVSALDRGKRTDRPCRRSLCGVTITVEPAICECSGERTSDHLRTVSQSRASSTM